MRRYTKILIEQEVYCEGSSDWRESCANEVSCYFFDGAQCGPGGGAEARYCCSDPEHKKHVASSMKFPHEKTVRLAGK